MDATESVLRQLEVETRVDPDPMLRAMLLCYLIDWKASLDLGRQIMPLDWTRTNWGPFSKDLINTVIHLNHIGSSESIRLNPVSSLQTAEVGIVNHIKTRYRDSSIESILQLAKSTYPMLYGVSGEAVDLPSLARLYKEDFAVDIRKSKERVKAQAPLD